ncbi:hypothetical protein TIFTF001_033110 [Ficus carica]|uniref:Uncharacterized protein n=1 Tax=Ficus carica TaxID=3494 RepID=A0AA88E1D9_FICCA|nr:hypothetical protein TIFTF001_033110 [Ficus carica]
MTTTSQTSPDSTKCIGAIRDRRPPSSVDSRFSQSPAIMALDSSANHEKWKRKREVESQISSSHRVGSPSVSRLLPCRNSTNNELRSPPTTEVREGRNEQGAEKEKKEEEEEEEEREGGVWEK